MKMVDEDAIRRKYLAIKSSLNERTRRLWAATEARSAGRGGFSAVLRVTRMSAKTLARGLRDLDSDELLPAGQIRRRGAGRKPAREREPGLMELLQALAEPIAGSDPESPVRYPSRSTRQLAAKLEQAGYRVSHTLVGQLLHEAGYSLHAKRKAKRGTAGTDAASEVRS